MEQPAMNAVAAVAENHYIVTLNNGERLMDISYIKRTAWIPITLVGLLAAPLIAGQMKPGYAYRRPVNPLEDKLRQKYGLDEPAKEIPFAETPLGRWWNTPAKPKPPIHVILDQPISVCCFDKCPVEWVKP
jgi:hypothetical protein